MSDNPRDKPLSVDIAGGVLTISIGVDTIAYAADHSELFERDDGDFDKPPKYKVTNADKFAAEVRLALLHEEEDGSGPLTRLFDEATERAVDDGCDGVEYECGITEEPRNG